MSECKPEAIKNQNILNTLNFKQLNMEQHIFNKFPEVFSDKLGLYNGDKIETLLKEGAKPKFIQNRAVPLALKNKIENELDRLEIEGAISIVKYSDWETPIVHVVKPTGEIRICGDYKITVNPFVKIERAPIPLFEDLLVGIKTGRKF